MKKDGIKNQWCVWRMFQQESFLFLPRMGSLVNHIAKNATIQEGGGMQKYILNNKKMRAAMTTT